MALVFCDANGIVMVDCLQKGHTINGTYNASLLRQLREYIKLKGQGKLSKGMLFHQDNVPVHKPAIQLAAIKKNVFELIENPPYSPYLAPPDVHLFPKSKKKANSSTHFQSDDGVIIL